jgi:hypothetical protein
MTSLSSNLPLNSTDQDSSTPVKTFFDGYYTDPVSFPVEQVDAVIGFFKSRGFDDISANSTSTILLQQAKADNVDIFKVIDTLKGLTEIQLSAVVAEVLNYNRQKTSVLGYKQENKNDYLETRNIKV